MCSEIENIWGFLEREKVLKTAKEGLLMCGEKIVLRQRMSERWKLYDEQGCRGSHRK